MKRIARFLSLALLAFLVALPVNATVSSETTRVKYTCDGATTVYAYPFKIYETDDILAVKALTSTGAETILVLNTDYAVSGAGGAGGNVTLTAGSVCGSGSSLTILRNIELTQETDYVDGQAFSAESLENAIDKVTLIQQQQEEKIGRAPKLPKTSSITDIALPNPSANNYIGWNAGATNLENKATPVVTTATLYEIDALVSYGGGTAYTQATIASALTAIGTTNKVTLLLRPGTWVISDNADYSLYTNVTWKVVPGALLQIASTKTLTIGGPFEAGLYRVFSGDGSVAGLKIVYPEWFGAAGDKSTDDITALGKSVTATPAYSTLFLTNAYRIASQWTITKNINITGPGYVWLDVGTSVDGIAAGIEGEGLGLQNVKWNFGGVFGAAGSSRNALVLNADRSYFKFPVKAGTVASTGRGVWLQWGICNHYAFIITSNINYGHSEVVPANGIEASTSAGAATVSNANEFDCIIEGIAGKGLYIFTSGDNGNNHIVGTYEGITDYGIHIKGGRRVHISNAHLEATSATTNQNEIVIEGHTDGRIGPGVLSVSGGAGYNDVQLIDSDRTVVFGLSCNRLSIDSDSEDTIIAQITTIGQTDNAVINSGKNTRRILASVENGFSVGVIEGLSDFNSVLVNGGAERWTTISTRPPGDWTYGGSNPTWAREATIAKEGTYSAKVTANTDAYPVLNLLSTTVTAGMPAKSLATVSGWIYIPTAGGQDVAIQVWWDVGASAETVATITTRDQWVKVVFTFRKDGPTGTRTYSDVRFIPAVNSAIMYLDGWSCVPSALGGAVYHTPNANEFPVYTGAATWDPGSVGASGYLANDFTCPGAALGMIAYAGAGVDVTDLIVSATVTAANVVTVVLFNPTVGAVDLGSSTWNVMARKLF